MPGEAQAARTLGWALGTTGAPAVVLPSDGARRQLARLWGPSYNLPEMWTFLGPGPCQRPQAWTSGVLTVEELLGLKRGSGLTGCPLPSTDALESLLRGVEARVRPAKLVTAPYLFCVKFVYMEFPLASVCL